MAALRASLSASLSASECPPDCAPHQVAQRCLTRNKMGAASANRSLRMELVRGYNERIRVELAAAAATVAGAGGGGGGGGDGSGGGGGGGGSSAAARARFDAIRDEFGPLVRLYLSRCQGGALSWAPFVLLQEQLRMEQVDAREKLLRDDLVAGRSLPPVSEPVKDAVALARLCGESAVPAWLREMGAEPRNAASSLG